MVVAKSMEFVEGIKCAGHEQPQIQGVSCSKARRPAVAFAFERGKDGRTLRDTPRRTKNRCTPERSPIALPKEVATVPKGCEYPGPAAVLK